MDAVLENQALNDLDVEGIMRKLPHRYPMLMIDRVTNMVHGASAVGIKNVTINEHFFQGHFPQKPVMPGVLLIEAMAQTAAVLVMATMGLEAEGRLVYFMTIESAKFRKPVVPGDTVHVHVEKQQQRGSVWKFRGEARVNGKVCAEAVYSAMISEK